jgi:hypothetical protein
MRTIIVLSLVFLYGCSTSPVAYTDNENVICPDKRPPLCRSEYGPFGSSRLGSLECVCQY